MWTRSRRCSIALSIAPVVFMTLASCSQPTTTEVQNTAATGSLENALHVQYLEIVTPDVDETCDALAQAHGVIFSEPIPELGFARTADLKNGGRIGVRAPMRATESPIVRPYLLVDDINAAVEAAEIAGAVVALPPMPIPGQGTFSIYILGGIEHGLWQLTQPTPHPIEGPVTYKFSGTIAPRFRTTPD